jgi:YegS/Rv2252/BmrU family lipid kinase
LQTETIHIIINPVAGGGKAGQKLDAIKTEVSRRFNGQARLYITQEKGHATRIASDIARQSPGLVVAAGGDGTIHEVVNGFFETEKNTFHDCVLGVLKFGSGNGCADSLALPTALADQFDLLARPGCVAIDIGHIQYRDDRAVSASRVFINEFQLGIGAEVVSSTGVKLKQLGGALAYGLTAVKTALTFRGPRIEVTLANGSVYSGRYLGVVVGNGAHTAGGMLLTTDASLYDGVFDLLLMHAMTVPVKLLNFPKIYSGKHIHSKSFSIHRSTSIAIKAQEVMQAEADGEVFALRMCEVDVLPSALRMKVKQQNPES